MNDNPEKNNFCKKEVLEVYLPNGQNLELSQQFIINNIEIAISIKKLHKKLFLLSKRNKRIYFIIMHFIKYTTINLYRIFFRIKFEKKLRGLARNYRKNSTDDEEKRWLV